MYWFYLVISMASYFIKTRFVTCPEPYSIAAEIIAGALILTANIIIILAMCKARIDPPENGD